MRAIWSWGKGGSPESREMGTRQVGNAGKTKKCPRKCPFRSWRVCVVYNSRTQRQSNTHTQMKGRGTSRYRYALPIGIKFHTKAGATISKHTEREASKRNSEWNLWDILSKERSRNAAETEHSPYQNEREGARERDREGVNNFADIWQLHFLDWRG